MEDLKPGFYKILNDELWHAPNAIYSPSYTLTKENRGEFNLPHDGWYWFDTEAEAKTYFNIVDE